MNHSLDNKLFVFIDNLIRISRHIFVCEKGWLRESSCIQIQNHQCLINKTFSLWPEMPFQKIKKKDNIYYDTSGKHM